MVQIEYASQRKIRERNKLYYRVNHWPIWIFVFFIAPGPLTFDFFAHGFDSRMAAWLGLEAAELSAGETVLLIGAGGGVGGAAAQIARRIGARVIGADLHAPHPDAPPTLLRSHDYL